MDRPDAVRVADHEHLGQRRDTVLGGLQPAEQEDIEKSPLAWGADYLVNHLFHRMHSKFEHVHSCSPKLAVDRTFAAAAAATQQQHQVALRIPSLVKRLASLAQWEPIFFLQHIRYDETPLDVRVAYADSAGADRQVAKTFVIERSYSILLRCKGLGTEAERKPGFFVLDLYCSPALRAAANAVGETISKVLDSLPQIPGDIGQTFKMAARLTEVDENGANMRAESFQMSSQQHRDWTMLLSLCMCHKTHTAATRGWELQPTTISGIIHTCRVLSGTGQLARLRDALSILTTRRFKVLKGTVCSAEASAFKQGVLDSILPALSMPKHKGLVDAVAAFFNFDWRTFNVAHICPGGGCCKDFKSSLVKAIWLVKRLFTVLRPTMFQKANWTDWPRTVPWFTLASSLHCIGVDAFQLAFTGVDMGGGEGCALLPETGLPVREDASEGPLSDFLDGDQLLAMPLSDALHHASASVDDDVTKERLANAISRKCAQAFMKPCLLEKALLLQVPLLPQQRLMHSLVRQTGAVWEREQLVAMASIGARQYRVGNLSGGALLPAFFQQTLEIQASSRFCQHLTTTEHLRSKILKLVMRPAALVHQLVRLRVVNMPYSLFGLLGVTGEARLALAETLLGMPKCLRDAWCRDMFAKFPTKEELCSDTAMNILAVLAKHCICTTVGTERVHSKNLRRSKGRTTHRADIPLLAAPHAGFAAASWVPRPLPVASASLQGQQKRKRGRPSNDTGGDDDCKKRRRGRSGGGGAWRAFCSVQLGGTPFSASTMRQLSARYAALTAEEAAYYRRLGQLGTALSIASLSEPSGALRVCCGVLFFFFPETCVVPSESIVLCLLEVHPLKRLLTENHCLPHQANPPKKRRKSVA